MCGIRDEFHTSLVRPISQFRFLPVFVCRYMFRSKMKIKMEKRLGFCSLYLYGSFVLTNKRMLLPSHAICYCEIGDERMISFKWQIILFAFRFRSQHLHIIVTSSIRHQFVVYTFPGAIDWNIFRKMCIKLPNTVNGVDNLVWSIFISVDFRKWVSLLH